jgi:hypothetical protein
MALRTQRAYRSSYRGMYAKGARRLPPHLPSAQAQVLPRPNRSGRKSSLVIEVYPTPFTRSKLIKSSKLRGTKLLRSATSPGAVMVIGVSASAIVVPSTSSAVGTRLFLQSTQTMKHPRKRMAQRSVSLIARQHLPVG